MKRLLPLLLVLAIGAGAYVYFNRPPTALVLTGVVTTNDVAVGPQIGGRIDDLRVKEGDTVKRGEIVAVIAPDELKAESAYAVHNVEGIAAQIQQSQAALRYEQQQLDEQVRQAESTLASTQAQQAAAAADLEAARINYERTQQLARKVSRRRSNSIPPAPAMTRPSRRSTRSSGRSKRTRRRSHWPRRTPSRLPCAAARS
ncbi:MAG: biotin/lipoyl-binding protein [Vicinamibacterales bacterium]